MRDKQEKAVGNDKFEKAISEKQDMFETVKEILISIEWKKSRMWGMNPHLTAWVRFEDETNTKFCCTASGCGYDKESQVISDVFNEFLK